MQHEVNPSDKNYFWKSLDLTDKFLNCQLRDQDKFLMIPKDEILKADFQTLVKQTNLP